MSERLARPSDKMFLSSSSTRRWPEGSASMKSLAEALTGLSALCGETRPTTWHGSTKTVRRLHAYFGSHASSASATNLSFRQERRINLRLSDAPTTVRHGAPPGAVRSRINRSDAEIRCARARRASCRHYVLPRPRDTHLGIRGAPSSLISRRRAWPGTAQTARMIKGVAKPSRDVDEMLPNKYSAALTG